MSEPDQPGDIEVGQDLNSVFERRDWLQITLSSIGDGVITADAHGRVNYLNPVAEELTGWTLADATGMEVERVFHIVNETTGRPSNSRSGSSSSGAHRRTRQPYPPHRQRRQPAAHRRQCRRHQG